LTPAIVLNISAVRCGCAPLPAELYCRSPGLRDERVVAMIKAEESAGNDGVVIK